MKNFLEACGLPFEGEYIKIPDNKTRINIDIGLSYNAPHSNMWIQSSNKVFVFGIEPVNESIENIKVGAIKKVPCHSDPLNVKYLNNSIFLIPCALGLQNNTVFDLYVTSGDVGCSSLFEPVTFEYQKKSTVMWRLDELLKLIKQPLIDYIKIDAQGSDLNIVKSGGHLISERVIAITLEPETDQYLNANNSIEAIDLYMTGINFKRICHPNTVDPTYVNIKYENLSNDCVIFQTS
jgi:hypothetical protein